MFFFFKQKTAYEMRISDWSSDVCSSDLIGHIGVAGADRQIVGDAVDRKGAVALVELQALGVLPAHLGVRTLVRIVRQALEIEAGSAKFLGLFANAVVEGAADPAAEIGRAAGRERVCQDV